MFANVCRFRNLPSNGLIDKAALRDLVLFFEGQKFQIFVSLWNGKSERKNVWKQFVDFDICMRMA